MSYSFKRYEWDLVGDEIEAAQFLINTAIDRNKDRFLGMGISPSKVTENAYEEFKRNFYYRVRRRLDLHTSFGFDIENSFGDGACVVSEDGTKLIGYRVEKD